MNRKLLAAALVAPILAWGPTAALAHGYYSKHHCYSKYHHHAKRTSGESYGSSKSMQNNGSTSSGVGSNSQDLNQGGSTAPSGSSGSRNKGQGI